MDEATASDRRRGLVNALEAVGVVRSREVARALRLVPRHLFLPRESAEDAYLDAPLAIGEGQTISAPHMVAIMTEALELAPGQRVLEVGGGSGYHAAVAAEIVRPGHVWSVERHATLAQDARRALELAGYASDVTVVVGDGSQGLAERAPFDRMSVACAAPRVPEPLVRDLAAGGRLVIPIGQPESQDLVLVRKDSEGRVSTMSLGPCRFVPLVGAHGF